MKKRILFVDDEQSVLDGLQRMLRPLRSEWDMSFVDSGAKALALMAENAFDVVIADMRMPGMDGAKLLFEVRRQHPETVRVVLSGEADSEAVLRAVPVAHQYLAKPCDAAALKAAIARVGTLQNLLADDALRSVVGRLEALPARPEVYTEISALLVDPEATAARVAERLESEPMLAAKLLQLVNSAFFGVSRRVSDLVEAVQLLGLDRVRDLVLSLEAFRVPPDCGEFARKLLATLQDRSLRCAVLARAIHPAREPAASNTFAGALLHDIGLGVCATHLSGPLEAAFERVRREGIPLIAAERAEYRVSHAEIGAYLLGIWNLPSALAEAAAFHHEPERETSGRPCALTWVHAASALVAECEGGELPLGPALDTAYLDRLGLSGSVGAWRSIRDGLASEAGQ
jgi:HD-like signal output (HDOD) protein